MCYYLSVQFQGQRVKWELAISFENWRNGKQTQAYYVTLQIHITILQCPFPTQFFFHPFRQCIPEIRRLPHTSRSHLLLNFLLDLWQPSTSSYCPPCELTFLPWRCRQEVTLKICYVSTKLHDFKPPPPKKKRFSSFSTWTFAYLFDLSLGSAVKNVKICSLGVCFCMKRKCSCRNTS